MYFFYVGEIQEHFKRSTEGLYNDMTANMTLSIGNRIASFESQAQ